MSDPNADRDSAKGAKPVIPGLDYYSPVAGTAKMAAHLPPRGEIALLNQMYGYFAD